MKWETADKHMRYDNNRILETLKAIDASLTSEEAIDHLMRFAKPLGFDKFLISQLINPLRPEAKQAMMYSDYPTPLIEERFTKNQFSLDPIVQYGMRSRHAFTWQQAYEFASRFGQEMAIHAREFRMNDGLMFPMRSPGRFDGGVSLAAEHVEISAEERADLNLAAVHCYYLLDSLQDNQFIIEDIVLTRREMEVLQFAAVGKTFWEIGMILGISEAAAKDAMTRARKRLGATNTAHAVSTAISRDLILP